MGSSGRWPEATQVVVNGECYGKVSTTEDIAKPVVITSGTTGFYWILPVDEVL